MCDKFFLMLLVPMHFVVVCLFVGSTHKVRDYALMLDLCIEFFDSTLTQCVTSGVVVLLCVQMMDG